MNDSRIDFSSLDPTRDAERWESRIQHIACRAAENRRRCRTVYAQLVAWSRPLLAIAATIALIGWCGLLAFGTRAAPVAVDPTFTVTNWAASGELPSVDTIIVTLGEQHGQE